MTVSERDRKFFKTLEAQKVPRVMLVVNWMLAIGMTIAILFMIFVPWVQTSVGMGTVTALNPNDRLQGNQCACIRAHPGMVRA